VRWLSKLNLPSPKLMDVDVAANMRAELDAWRTISVAALA